METAGVTVQIYVHRTGEQLTFSVSPNATVRQVLEDVCLRAHLEPSQTILVMSGYVLENGQTMGSYGESFLALEAKTNAITKLKNLYHGQQHLVAWLPQQQDATPSFTPTEGLRDLGADTLGLKTMNLDGQEWTLVPLLADEHKERMVPHIQLHVPGDKRSLDIPAFKRAVAEDLELSPDEIVVLSLQDASSYFVNFTVKPRKTRGETAKDLYVKAKAKMKVFVDKVNSGTARTTQKLIKTLDAAFRKPKPKPNSRFDFDCMKWPWR